MIPIADIIKFDLIETPLETIEKDISLAISQKKILLAEKIETKEEFLKAKEMGFHLFQGYFFSKPSIVGKSYKRSTSKIQYSRILLELKKEEPSYQVLAEIIEKDVNLAYRLIRISSLRTEDELIYSVKRALTYMGMREIERWINILMLQDLGQSKPNELIKMSLIRSRFAETIAIGIGLSDVRHEAALMGLFSTLDAMLDQTMENALKDMAISKSIIEALVYHKGVLYPIYELLIAYERGNWTKAIEILNKINMDVNILYEEYLAAIEWANKIFKTIT